MVTNTNCGPNRRQLLQAFGLGLAGLGGATATAQATDSPDASLTFEDQESGGESVVVGSVAASVDFELRVWTEREDGDSSLNGQEVLSAGAYEDIEIELDVESIDESGERIVAVESQEDGEILTIDRAFITLEGASDILGVNFIEADSDAGFNYPYYLYVPAESLERSRPLLVEPNNTGTSTDNFEEHRDAAQRRVTGRTQGLSDELTVPALVPVFPRPRSDPVDWQHYVHALDAETMNIDEGPLERVDLQLRQMIEHARELLADSGYPTDDEILLNGFSASGNFVNRFTALHPDVVRAVTAGGINGTAILPRSEVDGERVPYQVGIADLPSIVGEEFDQDAWQDVDQLVYLGGDDENDTIPYDDAWSNEQRELALDVYGHHMQEDRMPFCKAVYNEAEFTGRFETYPNIGHRTVMDDVVEFHRKHVQTVSIDVAEPPSVGDTKISITATAKEGTDTYEITVDSDERGDLTATAVKLHSGDILRSHVELSEAIEEDESVTVRVQEQPDGEDVATAETAARGRVSFAEQPTAGDTAVHVEYALSTEYTSDVSIRLDTEEGDAVLLDEISPGDSDTRVVELPEDTLGVPLFEGREVSLVLVDDDPAGIDPIAAKTVEIAAPANPVVEVTTVDVDDIAERGEIVSAEITLRGLGGGEETASVSVLANGERVATESVSVATGERVSIETGLRVDEVEESELVVSVEHEDTSQDDTVVIAELPDAGLGTQEDPFQVANAEELAYAGLELDAHYKLVDDVDLSSFRSFARIGTGDERFTGHFDGQGHEIRHVTITESSVSRGVGLFGSINDATIRNVHLVDAVIEGEGAEFVGGLVGTGYGSSEISQVSVSGEVRSDERIVGGIVGGTMSGGQFTISRAVSRAEIHGNGTTGGILGQCSGDTVKQSYALGSLSSPGYVGGILGQNWFGGKVEECYCAASIDADGGGLIGRNNEGEANDSYWDTEATGQSESPGGGTGLTTDEMAGEVATEHMEGFEFETTWETTDKYPKLAFESELDDEPPQEGHPSGVAQETWNAVTEENEPREELTFDDLVDAIQAYQEDGELGTTELSFQDLVDLIQWYQG